VSCKRFYLLFMRDTSFNGERLIRAEALSRGNPLGRCWPEHTAALGPGTHAFWCADALERGAVAARLDAEGNTCG